RTVGVHRCICRMGLWTPMSTRSRMRSESGPRIRNLTRSKEVRRGLVVPVSSLRTKDGRINRMDAPFFVSSPGTVPVESSSRLSEVAELRTTRVDPKNGADSQFTYVDIGSIDTDDGFTIQSDLPRALAPSRARIKLTRDDVVISKVRPERNAVALITS